MLRKKIFISEDHEACVSLFQGLPGLPGMKVSIMSQDLMSITAKMSVIELYGTDTCGVSHHRATPAVCSGSFRSKETEVFPEHQDSPYVFFFYFLQANTSLKRFTPHSSLCTLPNSSGTQRTHWTSGTARTSRLTGTQGELSPSLMGSSSKSNWKTDEKPVLQGDPGLPGPPGEKVRLLVRKSTSCCLQVEKRR